MTDSSQLASDELIVERHEQYWLLRLNRPEKMNALSADLVEALLCQIDAAEKADIPMLVFQGEGRNFSAGFDFTDLETDTEGDLLLRFVRIETLLQKIAYTRCLTVALVHGANFGAGVDIIASCKRRVAAPGSRFRMPGLKFGLALGTGRLAQLLGTEVARDLLQTTRMFSADDALENGFVHQLADAAGWADIIRSQVEVATSLTTSSRAALYELTLQGAQPDRDMAALVTSASNPGLKERIRAFRAA
ncbi:enoyl-CoA hydratase/isomerase family protein [Alcaligenaceae bacterium]|nr:enoyl-CoA hydratase/isomerase family protein [Alcaligenaceae bacterium]